MFHLYAELHMSWPKIKDIEGIARETLFIFDLHINCIVLFNCVVLLLIALFLLLIVFCVLFMCKCVLY